MREEEFFIFVLAVDFIYNPFIFIKVNKSLWKDIEKYLFENRTKKVDVLDQIETTRNDKLDGLQVYFKEKMKIECFYFRGQIHGTWRELKEFPTFDDEVNLFLFEEKYYVCGRPCGLWKKWSDSGQLIEERPYKNYVVHGTLKSYYDDGKPKRILPFINGVCDGDVYEYSKEGNLSIKKFKNGDPVLEKEKDQEKNSGNLISNFFKDIFKYKPLK